MKGDDIFMFELFHQGDLTDGSRRGAFFGVKMDFLERNEFASLTITSFEHL